MKRSMRLRPANGYVIKKGKTISHTHVSQPLKPLPSSPKPPPQLQQRARSQNLFSAFDEVHTNPPPLFSCPRNPLSAKPDPAYIKSHNLRPPPPLHIPAERLSGGGTELGFGRLDELRRIHLARFRFGGDWGGGCESEVGKWRLGRAGG